MTRILLSCGEASGDLHAGAVTRALKQLEPGCEVFGMGGDGMRAAGGEVLFDIKDHSVMGFWEVLKKLPDIFRLEADFRKVMEARRPDVLLTIDYPGFNMRLCGTAKKLGIPTVDFIAPSAWAWRRDRAKKVVQVVDMIASIFPFEYDLYKEYGAKLEFVGHPLVDVVAQGHTLTREAAAQLAGKALGQPLVLLLPGSRAMEIERLLPVILDAAKLLEQRLPGVRFAMPRASTIPREQLEAKIRAAGLDVVLTEGHTYDIMSVADLALATSGTVTLEAALCDLGCVILYKANALSFAIARRIVDIPNIGLPNIVAGRRVVPELLQDDCTAQAIAEHALALLEPARNAQLHADLAEVRRKLGEPGAVRRVAELVLRMAKKPALPLPAR